jgi:hypothetical protein
MLDGVCLLGKQHANQGTEHTEMRATCQAVLHDGAEGDHIGVFADCA